MNTKRRRRAAGLERVEKQIGAAHARVGQQVEPRLRWLVDFARRRHDYTTRQLQGESLSARWEAWAFAYIGTKPLQTWRFSTSQQPPSWAEVTDAYAHLWQEALTPLKANEPISAQWRGLLWLQPGGSLKAITDTSELPFLEAFMVRVYEVLRDLAQTRVRIRFCPVCEQPFVSKRADAKLCPTGSCRTLVWRRRHRREFQAARRKAYHRRMVEKTGNPNVRVKRRAKDEP